MTTGPNEWLTLRLSHMRDAALQACQFVEGYGLDDFVADARTHQACALNLIVIGEAARRILDRHPEFADRRPQIAWRSMAGMRNRIAHGYEAIDLQVVWETIEQVLPELVAEIEMILAEPPDCS